MRPHEILGVGPHASAEEIKTAYRRLAKQHHPDLNPGDPGAADRFKRINAAYEAIGNEEAQAADPIRPDRHGSRKCTRCKGTGLDPLKIIRREAGLCDSSICDKCGGSGRVGSGYVLKRKTPGQRARDAETRWRQSQGRW